ncbi:cache domain-containing protein [Falsiroseomonas sp.]|uniref:cache domain-containing protein n=1 Tax=Falsiroseomonas sp. TaxID=2870721 RepID=UPI003F6E7971
MAGAAGLGAAAWLLHQGRTPEQVGEAHPPPSHLEFAAQRLTLALDLRWQAHLDVARSISGILARPGQDPVSQSAAMRQVMNAIQEAFSPVVWMGVAQARSGAVVSATQGILEGADVSHRPWFAAGLQGPYAGDVHEAVLLQNVLHGPAQQEPLRLVDYACPLRDAQDSVVAVLASHLDWNWIKGLVRQSLLPRGRHLVLLSRTGSVLFAQDGAPLDDLDALPRAPLRQAADGPSFGWSVIVTGTEAAV